MRVRTLLCRLAVTAGLVAALAFGDDPDDAWKNLVMQALSAAGAGDYGKAEQVFQKALHEAERFGPGDPRVGATLNSVGLVYKAEKRYTEAEASFRRSLAILEKAYGYQSIDVANINFNIATVLSEQGKAPAALPFLEKSLAGYRRQLGPQSLKTASVLCMIGDAHRLMRDWAQAEGPLKQCAATREANGGVFNGELGDALLSLAIVYDNQGKYALADPRFRLAEKIREKTLGIMSPGLADVLEIHSAMLKKMGREVESAKDAALAAAIRRNEHKGR
ncbi:MAG: tetratricopeptide repeat protein [Acidobacteriota bacterium]